MVSPMFTPVYEVKNLDIQRTFEEDDSHHFTKLSPERILEITKNCKPKINRKPLHNESPLQFYEKIIETLNALYSYTNPKGIIEL